jgi:type I restriction enzyme M protein
MAVNNGSNNTASIGFEQQIWAAADILRGNMDAAEYKHVVLGLMLSQNITRICILLGAVMPFLNRYMRI